MVHFTFPILRQGPNVKVLPGKSTKLAINDKVHKGTIYKNGGRMEGKKAG